MNLKFRSIKAILPLQFGNLVFPLFLFNLIGRLLGDKRWGSEDKIETFDTSKLFSKSFVGINRKTGSCNSYLPATGDLLLEVIT